MDNDFGKRLRELRARFNMNQIAFAEKVGISRASLCLYESGKVTPEVETICKIARSCGTSLDWLCGITPTEKLTETQWLQQFGMLFAPESPFRIERESDGRAVVYSELARTGKFFDNVIQLSSAVSIGALTDEMYRECIRIASMSSYDA